MPKKRKTATEKLVIDPEQESTEEKSSAGVMGLIDTDATDEEIEAFVDGFNEMVDALESEDTQ